MRLFVAINLPPELRTGLERAAKELRSGDYPVRWVKPEYVHLTLKFLGEVRDAMRKEVERAIARAADGRPELELSVSGFGAFPSAKRPRVIWAGVGTNERLSELAERLEEEMAGLGFEREGRAFRPHLTLGRARRESRQRDFDGLEQELAALEYHDRFTARAVDLMRSQLRPSGAEYSVIGSARLG